MGFPTIRCKRALLANAGNPEAAIQWLFEHMDDPDIDAPLTQSSSDAQPADPGMISMLQDMGFTAPQATKALRETVSLARLCASPLLILEQNGDVERAVEWLFSHPDDAGDSTESAGASSAPPSSTNPGGSARLPAKYRLKAFISHKGPSVHSGHYVAHIRFGSSSEEEQWVLFNDEKVVKADQESVDALKQLAYLYIYERV